MLTSAPLWRNGRTEVAAVSGETRWHGLSYAPRRPAGGRVRATEGVGREGFEQFFRAFPDRFQRGYWDRASWFGQLGLPVTSTSPI